MGAWPQEFVQGAGNYLLSVLQDEPTTDFRRFYDGSDEAHDALIRATGMTKEQADRYSPEGALGAAIGQLVKAGIVTTKQRSDLLVDDEPNFDIEVTERGQFAVSAGTPFDFEAGE